jgi:hypothetical protein
MDTEKTEKEWKDKFTFKRKSSRRSRATAKWLEDTDPIKITLYYILVYLKLLVIALVVYISVLTLSECLFTIENIGSVAKGSYNYHEKEFNKILL